MSLITSGCTPCNSLPENSGDLFGWSPPPAPDVYPAAPGFKGERGGPSELAAKKIAPAVTGLRKLVLGVLQGGETLSADQVAVRLERSPFSIRPRVCELAKLGLVEAAPDRTTNESGMTAHRWQVTEAGRHV